MIPGTSEKVSILISALEANQRGLGAIGGRAQSIGLGSLVLLLGAGGWLVQSGKTLADDQTAIICLGVLVAWIVLRFVFMADLRAGFLAQQKMIGVVEERLGFYAEGRFGPGAEAVLSPTARGAKKGSGQPFRSATLMVDIGLIIFLVAALSRSDWARAWAGWALRQFHV